MHPLKDFVQLNSTSAFFDYLKLYKLLMAELQSGNLIAKSTFKIALMTSFTSYGIKEVLTVECAKMNILADIYVSDYNQYRQEILDLDSNLYRFAPQMLILFIDMRAILGELFFSPYTLSAAEREQWVQNQLNELLQLVEQFKANSSATVLLHNLEVPNYSPLGIQENRQPYGYIESIEDLNKKLQTAFKTDFRSYVFDYNAFSASLGKLHLYNSRMYYMADMKLDASHFAALARQYLAYIRAFTLQTKKCIVLDLDGVLWGGIIGEDGLEGIQLGPIPEGRPFWEFQKLLLALYNRGILLAINSKNNPEDVLKAIREHPYMVLKETHFAAIRINWQDKATNMQALAEEINIGLDSLVFIDDDALNCEIVKKTLPMVEVIQAPSDAAKLVSAFCDLDLFNAGQLTAEDLQRGKNYSAKREMLLAAKNAGSIEEFLKDLHMDIVIEPANDFSLPRLTQLTQKTNQLNMTTRRYTQQELESLAESPHYLVLSISVKDKFIDHGIVGVVIVKKGDTTWLIDTLLLSCRVIGRNIENAMLSYVVAQAKACHAQEIVGEYIPTEKNKIAAETYSKFGFAPQKPTEESKLWVFSLV